MFCFHDPKQPDHSEAKLLPVKRPSRPMTTASSFATALTLLSCAFSFALLPVSAQTPVPTPTGEPSGVAVFTDVPSAELVSTAFPSGSVAPSSAPSSAPSNDGPTGLPSSIPSDLPSDMPSLSPTPEPTFDEPSSAASRFRQSFSVENGRVFSETETLLFRGLYASYTPLFAPPGTEVEGKILTLCDVVSQQIDGRRLSLAAMHKYHMRARRLQASTSILVDFNMTYTSNFTNVTSFPLLFQQYVNLNLVQVAQQMQLLGLNVSEAFPASRVINRPEPTMQPTITAYPTTVAPSMSSPPSAIPSDMPSLTPSIVTSSPSSLPSSEPTFKPSIPPRTGGTDVIVIAVSIVVAGSIVLIGLLVYYRKRKLVRELAYQSNAVDARKNQQDAEKLESGAQADADFVTTVTGGKDNISSFQGAPGYGKGSDPVAGGVVSPSESLVSNQSLLSAGNSLAGDSGDEVDATHNLADEFDQYKDQNLEKMRAGIEGNLAGFDGMMSQALTRALIDEDDTTIDPTELLWGGSGHLLGAEIEASALGEVTDWLKRKESASDEERRLFMQETLNKMVSSVRHGVLGPEEASRSIHECAALLGLQLATEIPVTTLIITGMRKTVTAEDMILAFSEFGDVSEAAVASNQRGFGILRFKTNQSVDRAMKKFRAEEIVVQDVAVQVKVLQPGSTTTSPDEDEPSTPASANPIP